METMIYCPNCGSADQFKLSSSLYCDKGVWKQQKKCNCGCITIIRYYEAYERLVYPSGNEVVFISDKKRGE